MCLFSKLFKTAVKHIALLRYIVCNVLCTGVVRGLQLKNKCTRDRRILTYIIATPYNLLYYYKLLLSDTDPKIKMTVYGDDQLFPSVVNNSDSSPLLSICTQTNHTPDQFVVRTFYS